MSEFVAKLKAERLAYDGLPQESRIQIIEEAIGKLLALPEDQAAVADGIALVDTAASYLATTFLPPGINAIGASVATKGVDLMLHSLVSWLEGKFKADQTLGMEGP